MTTELAPRAEETGRAGARRPGRPAAALAGLAAAALTLAVADLVAQLSDPATSPLIAVGETFIDLTPGWLKDAAVSAFGTNDKLALLVSMGVVVAALAAVAGLLVRRRPVVAGLLVVLLGAAGAAAAVGRPGAAALAAVPSAVGTAAGLVALLLAGRALRGEQVGRGGAEQAAGGPQRRRYRRRRGARGRREPGPRRPGPGRPHPRRRCGCRRPPTRRRRSRPPWTSVFRG